MRNLRTPLLDRTRLASQRLAGDGGTALAEGRGQRSVCTPLSYFGVNAREPHGGRSRQADCPPCGSR
jgi:hypothetical protein